MNRIQTILETVESGNPKLIDTKSKAKLICPIEPIQGGYLFELFPGLTESEVALLVQSYRRTIPEDFLDFLRLTNGANLFCRNIRIAGLEYPRGQYRNCKVPDALWQTDIHRTSKTPAGWLFFAVYKKWKNIGMSHVCFDLDFPGKTKPVYCLPYNGNEILQKWDSFEAWFCEEYERYHVNYSNGDYVIADIANGALHDLRFLD